MTNITNFSNTNANFAQVLEGEKRGKKQRRKDSHLGRKSISGV